MVLVGYWPLREDSGSTAEDYSGNGNDGTINDGGDSTVPGDSNLLGGSTYSFDGSNDNVVTTYTPPQNADFSVAFWFKSSSSSGNEPLVNSWSGGGSTGIVIGVPNHWVSGDNFCFGIRDTENGDADNVQTDSGFGDGNWHHAVCIRRYNPSNGADQLSIYIDGEDVSTTNERSQTCDSLGTNDLRFGDNPDQGYNYGGNLAEVRFYNHALSEAEIQYLYTVGLRGDYSSPRRRHV